jgi:hypothetical protein
LHWQFGDTSARVDDVAATSFGRKRFEPPQTCVIRRSFVYCSLLALGFVQHVVESIGGRERCVVDDGVLLVDAHIGTELSIRRFIVRNANRLFISVVVVVFVFVLLDCPIKVTITKFVRVINQKKKKKKKKNNES